MKPDNPLILIVDDDPQNRDILARTLIRLGYAVTSADDGITALDALEKENIQLVLLDILMPEMSGLEVLERRGANPRLRDIPFIVISALDELDSVVRCIELGAEDYLPKPFNTAILRARISAALEKKHLRDREREYLSTIEAQSLALAEWNRSLEQRVAQQLEVLQEDQDRFRAVLEAATDAIICTDAAGSISYTNSAANTTFGYETNELMGRPLASLIHEAADFWTGDSKRQGAAPPLGQIADLAGVRKDGSEFPADLSLARWDTSGGYRYVGIVRDQTRRKEAAQELMKSEERLRQAQKMEAIGLLAGGVAHDFNNLLTVILGFGELLANRLPVTSPERPLVDQISDAASRAAALTRQLLAFSRRQILQPEILDLNSVVGDMDLLLRRLIGVDITFMTTTPGYPVLVKVDRGQMEQVLLNLVVNARDAMPTGGKLIIQTGIVDLGEAYMAAHGPREYGITNPGRYAQLVVTDTGEGMEADTQARAFEPFFTTKEQGRGTGLGLSTVYGIVKQSGGDIWIDSQPGHGASFEIYLPNVAGQAPQSVVPVPAKAASGTETVLIVEDEPGVLSLACRTLQTEGYTVLEASDPLQALEICERDELVIDLLLTDLVMRGMDGRELAERIGLRRPRTQIIYMSGYTDDVETKHGLAESRETGYLAKPFTPTVLATKVREMLDRSRDTARQLLQ